MDKTEVTFVRLTKEQKEWVRSQINKDANTMSTVIRDCVEKARTIRAKEDYG